MDYNEKKQKLERFLNERLPLGKNEKITVYDVYDDNVDILVAYHTDHEISLGIYERTDRSLVINIKEFEKWMAKSSINDDIEDILKDEEDDLRQTGKSTRIADAYVQKLFQDGEIQVRDHIDKLDCHKKLFRKIINRLRNEHHNSFEIDKKYLIIKLIK